MTYREGGLAHIRFNRPAALNAIDLATAQGFHRACRQVADDPQAMQAEARRFAACAATADFAEDVAAFMGRRAPKFTGT